MWKSNAAITISVSLQRFAFVIFTLFGGLDFVSSFTSLLWVNVAHGHLPPAFVVICLNPITWSTFEKLEHALTLTFHIKA